MEKVTRPSWDEYFMEMAQVVRKRSTCIRRSVGAVIVLDNRIMTTDVRLIRRIVRDRKTRGHSASRTLNMWASVVRGERNNIFPFQESADVMFNSTLVYEPAVLRMYAERFLLEVPQDDEAFGVDQDPLLLELSPHKLN